MATNPIDRDEEPQPARLVNEKLERISASVSPQHRDALMRALTEVSSRTFNEALAAIPDVGLDSDFAPRRD